MRRSATAIAILAFFSVYSFGGLCFMDMASAASPHECCKKTGITAAPPRCCSSGQITVHAAAPAKAPRALPCTVVQALKVSFVASKLGRPAPVEVHAAALSPPTLLRI